MKFTYGNINLELSLVKSRRYLIPSPAIKIIFFRLTIFFLLLLWCLGFTPGLLNKLSSDFFPFFPFLKKIYSSVCIQNNERSLHLFGSNLFVCARCTGIYFGALTLSFTSVLLKRIRIEKRFLLAGLSFILSDILLNSPGIFAYSKFYAFVTGFFFGSCSFLYILNILENEFFIKE